MTSIKFQGRDFSFADRDDADRSVISEIFSWREYRSVESLLAEAAVIIDGGAHIGVWSAYASAINPVAKIYSFEPDPDNFLVLRRTVTDNHLDKIKLFQLALAGTSGPRLLSKAPDSINHALLPSESSDNGRLVQAKSLRDFCVLNKIKIIDILKLDIEGGEYELLDAWQTEDFNLLKTVILEYHQPAGRDYHELEDKFRQNGFSVQIFPSRFDKDLGFMLARNKRTDS
jgi:FkbM family methyltransferase